MPVVINPIENGESGLSIREKLNLLIAGAATGALGSVTPEDIAALIDTTPPAVPEGLTLTSEIVDGVTILTIAWDFNSEGDFLYYDFQVKEGDGSWIGLQTSAEIYTMAAKPNVAYSAWLRAVDKSGNPSLYCVPVTHTTAADDIPPAMPIGIQINAGLESIWITWIANTESDLARYELYESASNATPLESATPSHTTLANNFVRAGLDMGTALNFWVRAVDTSGNVSPWSTVANATTGELRGEIKVALIGVTFAPGQDTGNRLEWTAGNISFGLSGEEPTIQALPSGQVDWISGTVYVCYVPGATEITTTTSLTQLYADDSVILAIYRGGTDLQLVLGKAFTDGGLILAQTIGANQLVADDAVITGAAQIANAIIEDAHITDLDAAKLIAGTTMTGEILVNGAYRIDDPAAGVNLGSTKILPGSISISTGVDLSNWIAGGGTYIDGAMLSVGSVTAEKASFGQRGLTIEGLEFESNKPATNRVAWSAGTIKYIGDDGNVATFNIASGSSAIWTTGTLYVYYVKGGTTLAATTTVATAFQADRVVLATYKGGLDLVTDYGRTIIDGSHIKTGSVDTAQMKANSITTLLLAAGAVTADRLDVTALSAISADLGTVTTGLLQNLAGTMIIDLDAGFISIAVP
ncbi:hypothetical protein [Mesorhizobium sp. M0859]|uniref:hypothetical protein n=1 Tax=Mesorhizobium sp. M0859 TaxID=2957014 RepID=UPI00333CBE23